jgi:uncharacterized protein (DUF2461 family)
MAGSRRRALAWFRSLADDNTRDYWARTKADYARDVKAPFLDLLARLDASDDCPRHADWTVYSPHRDARRGPDVPPLKDFIGAVALQPGGCGLFVKLDARGLLVATGNPYFAPDQLPRWRAAVAAAPGADLVDAIASAEGRDLRVGPGYPKPLTTAPRGVALDHPRIGLLRWKGLECYRRLPLTAWDRAETAVDLTRAAWSGAMPVVAWLDEHVGPSALERPRR